MHELHLSIWSCRSCFEIFLKNYIHLNVSVKAGFVEGNGGQWVIYCWEDDGEKSYGWKQIVIYINWGFQDHTRSEKPLVSGWDTRSVRCTRKHMHIHTLSHFLTTLAIFVSLCPAFYKWQPYYFHCLAYYSIKPLIGLDSFYLLLVQYGSLGALKQLKNRVEKVNVLQT